MNEWSKHTLELVKKTDYLDKLQEVYPHNEGERNIDDETLDSIRKAYKAKKNIDLLNHLLDLPKFPYKDSYVGFLRKDRSAIDRNPRTVERICNRLYDKGIDEIVEGIQESMEANRRRGNSFTDWLERNFDFVSAEKFGSSKKGVVVLNASELEARDFCNKVMGVGISKRPDFVAKAGNKYVIGEAKFLSNNGGSQDRGFDDGMALAKNPSGKAYKLFIMDGVYWIETGIARFKQIEYGTATVLSVLLLKKYMRSVAMV